VNYGPRSILLHCYYRLPFTRFIHILANYYLYHSIRLILCLQQTSEIDNLTVSWGKVLGCVVCRFHIAAGAKLRHGRGAIYELFGAVAKLASINLWKLVLSHTGSINLGFILREDLLLCSSYLPLGVPNWVVIFTPSSTALCFPSVMIPRFNRLVGERNHFRRLLLADFGNSTREGLVHGFGVSSNVEPPHNTRKILCPNL
jgi:hypothetical protein